MRELTNEEIAAELRAQSILIYEVVGLSGIGPTKEEYDRNRPDEWPYSLTILKWFGLSRSAEGWRRLLNAFGFITPTPSEIQTTAQRRKESGPTQPSIREDDESYPALTGSLMYESITERPLGNGWVQRTTREYIQLR